MIRPNGKKLERRMKLIIKTKPYLYVYMNILYVYARIYKYFWPKKLAYIYFLLFKIICVFDFKIMI
jgi:hypothetical protein